MKIKPNDVISICVEKNTRNSKSKTLWHVLTSYKYIDSFCSNMFNYDSAKMKYVKIALKQNKTCFIFSRIGMIRLKII